MKETKDTIAPFNPGVLKPIERKQSRARSIKKSIKGIFKRYIQKTNKEAAYWVILNARIVWWAETPFMAYALHET